MDKLLEEEKIDISSDSEESFYLIIETKIYYDEIYRFVIKAFINEDDATRYAEEHIKRVTNDYKKFNGGFIGNDGDTAYVITITKHLLFTEESNFFNKDVL